MDEPRTQTAYHATGNGRSTDEPEAPSQAFGAAMSQVAELKEYTSHFISAKLDGLKLTARKLVVLAVLGVIGLVVAVAMVATACVLLLSGLAQALGAALRGHVWAGNLIVGFVVLLGIALGAWLGVRAMFKSSKKQTVERYERRLQRQRVDLGADARQRSAEHAAEKRNAH